MSNTISNPEESKAPNLELNDNFESKVSEDFFKLMRNKPPYSNNLGIIFELGARYAIANLKELVKPSSLRDFAEYLHKRYYIDDKQRAQLIEKFATMTFADSHNPELVTDVLPQIKTMVDAIINCQCTEKPISKTDEI